MDIDILLNQYNDDPSKLKLYEDKIIATTEYSYRYFDDGRSK